MSDVAEKLPSYTIGKTRGRTPWKPMQSPKRPATTSSNGSLIISEKELAALGGDDPVRGRKELRLLIANEMGDNGPVFTGPVKECPARVRVATPRDEPALLELWLQDLRDNAAHVAEIDEQKVLEHIRIGTRQRGGIVGVIDDRNGKAAAMVVLVPMQWHWSQAWFLQEMCSYCHPDHRRSGYAEDLLTFQKWASDELSRGYGYRVHVLNGALGAWRVQAKTALYRRKFRQAGSVFIYPAPTMKGV